MNEKQFLLQALTENLRLDGREFTQYRPIDLSFGDEHGVAEVKLGKTMYAEALPLVVGFLLNFFFVWLLISDCV